MQIGEGAIFNAEPATQIQPAQFSPPKLRALRQVHECEQYEGIGTHDRYGERSRSYS